MQGLNTRGDIINCDDTIILYVVQRNALRAYDVWHSSRAQYYLDFSAINFELHRPQQVLFHNGYKDYPVCDLTTQKSSHYLGSTMSLISSKKLTQADPKNRTLRPSDDIVLPEIPFLLVRKLLPLVFLPRSFLRIDVRNYSDDGIEIKSELPAELSACEISEYPQHLLGEVVSIRAHLWRFSY